MLKPYIFPKESQRKTLKNHKNHYKFLCENKSEKSIIIIYQQQQQQQQQPQHLLQTEDTGRDSLQSTPPNSSSNNGEDEDPQPQPLNLTKRTDPYDHDFIDASSTHKNGKWKAKLHTLFLWEKGGAQSMGEIVYIMLLYSIFSSQGILEFYVVDSLDGPICKYYPPPNFCSSTLPPPLEMYTSQRSF